MSPSATSLSQMFCFANPVELSSQVLTPSSLTCQPRCILNAKTIEASLFLSYGKEISPRLKKITLFAWLVPAMFLCMGLAAQAASDAKTILIITLKKTPTNKGQYFPTENNGQTLTAVTNKVPGLWHTQNLLAFCNISEVSSCPLVFRVMLNLRNHKQRWAHRGPKNYSLATFQPNVSRAMFFTTLHAVEAVERTQALLC